MARGMEAFMAGLGGSLPSAADALVKRLWARQDSEGAMAEKRRAEAAALAEKEANDRRDSMLWALRNSTLNMGDQFELESELPKYGWNAPAMLGAENQAVSTEEMLARVAGEQKGATQNYAPPTVGNVPKSFGRAPQRGPFSEGLESAPKPFGAGEAKGLNRMGMNRPVKEGKGPAGFKATTPTMKRPLAEMLEKGIYRRPVSGGSGVFRETPAMQIARNTWADVLKAKPMIGPVTEEDMKVYAAKLKAALVQRYKSNGISVTPQELSEAISAMTGIDVSQ